MEDFQTAVYIILGVTSLVATVFYYFFRFYFFKEDQRLKKPLEEKASTKTVSLTEALSKSKKSFWSKAGHDSTEVQSLEELEEALYMADLGPQTVNHLIEQVKEKTKGEGFDLDRIKGFFKEEMASFFEDGEGEKVFKRALEGEKESRGPYVISIVGVNGAGKTTTIGKLAFRFLSEGKKVMVAAGDTFRAAAGNQLGVWAERSQALIFQAPPETKDPSAVAFQAYEKAKKEGVDILLIDTAGRLHTQDHLMKELEKVQRVLKKHDPSAPHECWMVLDSNTGMNAYYQAESFHKSLGLTALILTKLDGSAKAGMALGVRRALGVPVLMIGVGEGIEDLRLFEPKAFVESLV
jgi:fused signal recognition particle receptor